MNAFSEIFRLAGKSYADALGLVNRAAPTLFVALIILGVGDIAGILAARLFETGLAKTVVGTLATIASLWFASPYLVHMMRLLLDDRIKPGLETFTGNTVNARFFAWSGLYAFIVATPAYVFSFAPPGLSPETADNPELITLMWVAFLCVIAVWIFYIRSVTLLPMIALGHDATLVQAFSHTRGKFWFLTGAAFLPVLPVLFAEFLLVSGSEGVVRIGLSVILSLIMEALALVVSANLYRWLMDNRK